MIDCLLIDVRLILDYEAVAKDTYKSVGVKEDKIKREPYLKWLPQALRADWKQATELQVVRDARLVERVLAKKSGVRELAMLDVAQVFCDEKLPVFVYSHETLEVLAALCERAGLSKDVGKLHSTSHDDLPGAVHEIVNEDTWMCVCTKGLTSRIETGIIAQQGRGMFIPIVNPFLANETAEDLLEVLVKRWR